MEHYREVMIALSDSGMKNRLKRPFGEEIMMTSFPESNKTSLSRKPCILDKKLV